VISGRVAASVRPTGATTTVCRRLRDASPTSGRLLPAWSKRPSRGTMTVVMSPSLIQITLAGAYQADHKRRHR